jgi:hypothetical protein
MQHVQFLGFEESAHLHVLLAGLLPAEARLREQRDVADRIHVKVAGLQPAVHLQQRRTVVCLALMWSAASRAPGILPLQIPRATRRASISCQVHVLSKSAPLLRLVHAGSCTT